jgi:hypothetical protein
MKTLIEKSILIVALGNPTTKSEFNIDSPSEANEPNFRSLLGISGLSVLVCFFYLDNENQYDGYTFINVVQSSDVDVIKQQITQELSTYINTPKNS